MPTTFDYMKGNVTFQGWALARNSARCSAVEIIVDGDYVGQAQYGFPRPDVQQQYPFVFNARTPAGASDRYDEAARTRVTV